MRGEKGKGKGGERGDVSVFIYRRLTEGTQEPSIAIAEIHVRKTCKPHMIPPLYPCRGYQCN